MSLWIGVSVSGEAVILVTAEVEAGKPLTIVQDQTIKLQSGDRWPAYKVLFDQVSDAIAQTAAERVIVKASALPTKGFKQALLDAAELRGIVIAAAGGSADVTAVKSAHISKSFGSRKFGEYLKDEGFWAKETAGKKLRSGSRDAAMLLLAARD